MNTGIGDWSLSFRCGSRASAMLHGLFLKSTKQLGQYQFDRLGHRSRILVIDEMFSGATSFKQPTGKWNVSGATDI